MFIKLLLISMLTSVFTAPPCTAIENVLDVTSYQSVPVPDRGEPRIITVRLAGKINHFGNPDFHAVVPGVRVSIAEFPASSELGIVSGEDGWWRMGIKKFMGEDLKISILYEKEGWITTKSNVITVKDEDDKDLAIQFIDPDLFFGTMKPLTEGMLAASGGDGAATGFRNAVVATVGKSWASMHDDRLPHGDPGATVTMIPGAAGPVYFNEKVMPDPAYAVTSVDGGVAWLNVPEGSHVVTAYKKGAKYTEVEFDVDPPREDGEIVLYIASPPDSIQGTDDSCPRNPKKRKTKK